MEICLIPTARQLSAPTATPAPAHATPAPTTCGSCEQTFKLVLTTDYFPSETTWTVVSSCPGVARALLATKWTELTEEVEVCPGKTYMFEIFDSWGDGILLCFQAVGSWWVLKLDGDVIESSDGDFGFGETHEFTVPDTIGDVTVPTCRRLRRASLGAFEQFPAALRLTPEAGKSEASVQGGHLRQPNGYATGKPRACIR